MSLNIGEIYSSNQLIAIHSQYIKNGYKFYNGETNYNNDSWTQLFTAPKYLVLKEVSDEQKDKALKIVAIPPNSEISTYLYFVPQSQNAGAAYKRLNKLTVKELIELAKKKKVTYSNLRKHDLILALQAKKK